MKSKKIATYGLLVALAFILSYIESVFPLPVPVPGIKLGLANLVVLTALYTMGMKEAFVLSLIRIVLVGFTFGSPSTMIFSLAGGLLSWLLMSLLKNSKLFSQVGVSIVGGISHNVGQIIAAIFVVENINIIYYLPFLLISGVITGTVIGILGAMIIKRLKNFNTRNP
jgi:heptaprenyl diphosphate synthase